MKLTQALIKRYQKTLRFIQEHVPFSATILDLGTKNPFSEMLAGQGYQVFNTKGEDLDFEPEVVNEQKVDLVIALEIFEHLAAPFNVLRSMKAEKLIASVPLKLWFASAYWNEKDDWDKHYHEFEIKQFNWLLKKTGWKIESSEIWKSAEFKFGIRPILRYFTPRYYIVYCTRQEQKGL
jgi:hypothetical protein